MTGRIGIAVPVFGLLVFLTVVHVPLWLVAVTAIAVLLVWIAAKFG